MTDAATPAPRFALSAEAIVLLAIGVYAIVFVGLVPWAICAQYNIPRIAQDFFRMSKPGGDYVASYEAGRCLLAGRDVYTRQPDSVDPYSVGELSRYSYPPLQAHLFTPLAVFPFEQSLHYWQATSVALILLSIYFASRLFERPWTVFFGGVLIYLPSTFLNFQLERGQTDALPLLCSVLSVFFARRRNDPYAAGAMLALGAAVKLIPAALALYYLLRRDWRTLLAAALSGGVLVLLTQPEQWIRWWTEILRHPAYHGLFVGSGVDHSLVYLFEGATWNLDAARRWARTAAIAMVAAYTLLVLLNRDRRRHALIELAILTAIVEVITPWSVNYKLVMLVFTLLAPFALLSIDAVRRRPIRYVLPLIACLVLFAPVFNEHVTRLPVSIGAMLSGAPMIAPGPVHPFLAERRAGVGVVVMLAYLFVMYAAATLGSWPAIAAWAERVRVGAWAAAGSVVASLLIVAIASLPQLHSWTPPRADAAWRLPEPVKVNEQADVVGCVAYNTGEGRAAIDLVFASRGPMPADYCVFMHAVEKGEDGGDKAVYGANFLPAVITSWWPRGAEIVLRANMPTPPGRYEVRVGFFSLVNGARYGAATLGEFDFAN